MLWVLLTSLAARWLVASWLTGCLGEDVWARMDEASMGGWIGMNGHRRRDWTAPGAAKRRANQGNGNERGCGETRQREREGRPLPSTRRCHHHNRIKTVWKLLLCLLYI